MVRKQKLIIKDERGAPNYMAAFSWTGSKDPAQVPPIFVAGGKVADAIMASQFSNSFHYASNAGASSAYLGQSHSVAGAGIGFRSVPHVVDRK